MYNNSEPRPTPESIRQFKIDDYERLLKEYTFIKSEYDKMQARHEPFAQQDKREIPKDLRKYIYSRDKGLCRYCGKPTGREFNIDHVYPWSLGGKTMEGNLVLSCKPCNVIKSNSVGIWPKEIGYIGSDTP